MQLCLYFASDNIAFRNGQNKSGLLVLCFILYFSKTIIKLLCFPQYCVCGVDLWTQGSGGMLPRKKSLFVLKINS